MNTRLNLPTVMLMCADCITDPREISDILKKCEALCAFGAVKFFTSLETDCPHKVAINRLATLSDYSAFLLTRAHEYIETPHVLTVQHDGWVLNPDAWNPYWLNYDYIGPLFIQEWDVMPMTVGSGGFSFRSKALMTFVAGHMPPWDGASGTKDWPYEDGVIAKSMRSILINHSFQFAPPLEASKFAQGGNLNPYYYVSKPFGFHGLWNNINRQTGVVGEWPKA